MEVCYWALLFMPLVILHHLLNVFVQLANKRGFTTTTKKKQYSNTSVWKTESISIRYYVWNFSSYTYTSYTSSIMKLYCIRACSQASYIIKWTKINRQCEDSREHKDHLRGTFTVMDPNVTGITAFHKQKKCPPPQIRISVLLLLLLLVPKLKTMILG
jgi:hypothetical protein